MDVGFSVSYYWLAVFHVSYIQLDTDSIKPGYSFKRCTENTIICSWHCNFTNKHINLVEGKFILQLKTNPTIVR